MGVQVGGFAVMRTKDLQRVAPLWLNYPRVQGFQPKTGLGEAQRLRRWAALR